MFRVTGVNECHAVLPIPSGRLLRHRDTKVVSHGMINVSIRQVNMLRNSSTLALPVPIILSTKFGFASVNGYRETYFVDALRTMKQRKL